MTTSPSPGGWLSPTVFTAACAALPLVSVDVYLTHGLGGHAALLLGRRANRPAQGWWFTPGGRIRKQEALPQALARVFTDELGLPAAWAAHARLLGAWDHFYPDSAFDEAVPTHYVNLAYQVAWNDVAGQGCGGSAAGIPPAHAWPVGQGAQHLAWRWWPLAELAQAPDVHPHVKAVLPLLRG